MEKRTRARYLLMFGSLIASAIIGGVLAFKMNGVWVWLSPIAGVLIGTALGELYGSRKQRNGLEYKEAFEADREKNLAVFPKHIQALEGLCEEVMPVWNSRIERAQHEVQEAVELLKPKIESIHLQLLEAGRLSKMMERGISAHALSGNANRTPETYGSVLSDIVDDLKDALRLKNSLLNLEGKLSVLTSELKNMAGETAAVSLRQTDLNLDDSTENGSRGHKQDNFSVVAAQVDELANVSEQTGSDISFKLEQANSSIISAFHAIEDHVRRNAHLLDKDGVIASRIFEAVRSEVMMGLDHSDEDRNDDVSMALEVGATTPLSEGEQEKEAAFP